MLSCLGFAKFELAHFIAKSPVLFGDQAAQGGMLETMLRNPLIPFAMIGLLFYALLIRPERKKKADFAKMLENLKKNDRIVTVGGIFATVITVQQESNEVTIRVDDSNNTKLRLQRNCVARIISAENSDPKKDL